MSKKSFNYTIEPWVTTNDTVEYTTNIFKVLTRNMKLESENHAASFSVIKAPDWINVVALTKDKHIVLVEQFRYGIEKSTLELPGGMVDPGEHPKETSIRELKEETGFAGDEVIYLGKVSSNPAILNNYTHTYLIKNCVKVSEQNLDGNERINVHTMPLKEFMKLVSSGEVHHSLVVAAVAKFLLYKNDLSTL